MGAAIPDISQRTACCLLQVRRSAMHRLTNGLIFQIWRFRQACRASGLAQEFITPYTPQKNGLIERFFQSLKEKRASGNIVLADLRKRVIRSTAG
ncbi:integrase core domain-containing protein [Nitrospira sp. Ecomares 2.1]